MAKIDLDFAFFKVLSRNDTGETGGHQGGVVIPKQISEYFPRLRQGTAPTVDHDIFAELFEGDRLIEDVATRFQLQTWRRTRKGEYRLTRNLQPLLQRANTGDILLFQRFRGKLDRFKISLLCQGTREFQEISSKIGSKRWGVTSRHEIPVTGKALLEAEQELGNTLNEEFEPFAAKERKRTQRTTTFARDEAFGGIVKRIYDHACAVCGTGLRTPSNAYEVHASHIIPVSRKGSHDPRNGICLCRTHHWAFDNGLFGLFDDYRIFVPEAIQSIPANASVIEFLDRPMIPPQDVRYLPATKALEWHRENVIL